MISPPPKQVQGQRHRLSNRLSSNGLLSRGLSVRRITRGPGAANGAGDASGAHRPWRPRPRLALGYCRLPSDFATRGLAIARPILAATWPNVSGTGLRPSEKNTFTPRRAVRYTRGRSDGRRRPGDDGSLRIATGPSCGALGDDAYDARSILAAPSSSAGRPIKARPPPGSCRRWIPRAAGDRPSFQRRHPGAQRP